MRLYHATLRPRTGSIDRLGLLTRFARGARRAVWAVTRSQVSWAILHVADRHAARIQDVVVYEIDVPRRWATRWRRGGWWIGRDVPPGRFRGVTTMREVSLEGSYDGKASA